MTETFYGSSNVSAAYSVMIATDQFRKHKPKGYKISKQKTNTVKSGNLYETTITVEYVKQ